MQLWMKGQGDDKINLQNIWTVPKFFLAKNPNPIMLSNINQTKFKSKIEVTGVDP